MISREEVEFEISKLQQQPLSVSSLDKLANLYIVRDHLENEIERNQLHTRNVEGAPKIKAVGNSEFIQAVRRKSSEHVFEILDELMDTLRVVNPRLYEGVMRRMDE